MLEYLRDRRLLLILDTCEHLLDACAALAQAVLRDAPGVTVLATSRQPLDMPGEHTFPIGPLPVPENDQVPLASSGADVVGGGDAVELFALRAAAAVPDFTVTPDNAADVDPAVPAARRDPAGDRAGGGTAARAPARRRCLTGSTTGSRC